MCHLRGRMLQIHEVYNNQQMNMYNQGNQWMNMYNQGRTQPNHIAPIQDFKGKKGSISADMKLISVFYTPLDGQKTLYRHVLPAFILQTKQTLML